MRDRLANWLRALADRVQGVEQLGVDIEIDLSPEAALKALQDAQRDRRTLNLANPDDRAMFDEWRLAELEKRAR